MTEYQDRLQTAKEQNGPDFLVLDSDLEIEADVIKRLEAAWPGVEIRDFGKFSPVDFYALRGNRVVAVLELKSRAHESTKYPTVVLSFRKWIALRLGSYGMGCAGVFVVNFTDGLFWIDLVDVPVGRAELFGSTKRGKRHDLEPMLHVPIAAMSKVKEG